MMMINGVDRDALSSTMDAIKADPGIAIFQFRLGNEWVDGGENRSVVDDFSGARQELRHAAPFTLTNDEPAILLSGDKGPNPVEFVLHALAGCLTTSLVYHAAARGMPVKGVRTRFEGDLDIQGLLGMSKTVRRGFSGIRVAFEIDGDFTDQQKSELVAMAEAHSPVFDIVTNGVPVICSLAEKISEQIAA